jgi:hypothetical protein
MGFAFYFLWSPVTARPSTTPVVLPVAGHQCDGPLENSVSAKADHARELAANYFAGMGFVLEVQDIARKVELFCTRESARQAVAAAFHAKESEIPATFSGTVQNATLFVVSPQIYKENFVGLYGADLWNDTEYDKLMTHEMVHSAHALVAKRLFGSEDGMGPEWLFEGLAIDASGQLPVSKNELRKVTIRDFDDFLQATEKGKLKAPVYIQYAVFYTYVRQFVSNKWIVENAGKPDVIDLIHRAIQAQAH